MSWESYFALVLLASFFPYLGQSLVSLVVKWTVFIHNDLWWLLMLSAANRGLCEQLAALLALADSPEEA